LEDYGTGAGFINALIKAEEYGRKFVLSQAQSASEVPFWAFSTLLRFASWLIEPFR